MKHKQTVTTEINQGQSSRSFINTIEQANTALTEEMKNIRMRYTKKELKTSLGRTALTPKDVKLKLNENRALEATPGLLYP